MNNRFAFLPMRPSNDLLGDDAALRSRLDEDSYLYFPGLLDRDVVSQVRRDILNVTSLLGWTERSIPLTSRCTTIPLREEDDEFIEGYQKVQKLQSFHELAHDERLLGAMRSVLGPTAFPHPLKIARLAFPDHYEASTPPHQDYPNNQGSTQLTAAWIPLSDIPPEMGGLAVLRGSHRWGLLPLEGHIGAGNRCAVVPPEMDEACRWVTTEFGLGDVLIFPSLTVHASLHNASEFHMRLSVDFRFQPQGVPLTEGCLEPHFGLQSWDEIYADWTSTDLQYYWKDLDFDVVPFEPFPIPGAGMELSKADFAQILAYERRVKARTERRMAALGQELDTAPRRSTTFERHKP